MGQGDTDVDAAIDHLESRRPIDDLRLLRPRRLETRGVVGIDATVVHGQGDGQVGPFGNAKLVVADDPTGPALQLDVPSAFECRNRDIRE